MDAASKLAIRHSLARLADGDRAALGPAYAALHPVVLAFCRRALEGDADADDVAQDALLRLFDRVGVYDGRDDPIPWVLGFAWSACRTHRRRALRRAEAVLHEPASTSDPERDVIEAELRAALEAAIGRLSDLDAETLRAALDERRGDATFRKRLQRAIVRLRHAWSA